MVCVSSLDMQEPLHSVPAYVCHLQSLAACLKESPSLTSCESLGGSLGNFSPVPKPKAASAGPKARRSSSAPPRGSETNRSVPSRAAASTSLRRALSCDSQDRPLPQHVRELERLSSDGAPSVGTLREKMAAAVREGAYGGICGNKTFKRTFEAALQNGQISLSVADLMEAELTSGVDSLPEAVQIAQAAWDNGELQVYCDTPEALQPDFFSREADKSVVWAAVMALREVYVSPVCQCLSWPLLRAVLHCLQREHIRSSLDIILEVCRGAFCLNCDQWDIVAAVGLAPEEACQIDVVPWPIQRLEGMDDEAYMLASTVVALNVTDSGAENKVFPPYSRGLEAAVEKEFLNADNSAQDIEVWLQDVHTMAQASGVVLTVPMILAMVGCQQALAPCVLGGALLWFWEKMCANAPRQQEGAHGTGANDEASSEAASELSDVSVQSREASAEEELKPLEAFLACFYDDLRSNRPLFLSQLNNLYRMRSGGHDIKYRNHGYSRMGEFLAEVPGVELVGSGNQMAVQVCDHEKLAELAEQVMQGLQKRIGELRARGIDTSFLEINYRRPQPVPKKILARVWDIFQNAENNEIPVNLFISCYKERFPHDKLRFKSLGYQDVRGLMAHVPFVEKVGGRRHSKYVLKADAAPPEGYRRQPAAVGGLAGPGITHRQQPSELAGPRQLPRGDGTSAAAHLSPLLARHLEGQRTLLSARQPGSSSSAAAQMRPLGGLAIGSPQQRQVDPQLESLAARRPLEQCLARLAAPPGAEQRVGLAARPAAGRPQAFQ